MDIFEIIQDLREKSTRAQYYQVNLSIEEQVEYFDAICLDLDRITDTIHDDCLDHEKHQDIVEELSEQISDLKEEVSRLKSRKRKQINFEVFGKPKLVWSAM